MNTAQIQVRLDGTGASARSPYAGTLALADNGVVAARMNSRYLGEARAGHDTWEARLTSVYAQAIAQDDPARLRAQLLALIGVAADWVAAINGRADQ